MATERMGCGNRELQAFIRSKSWKSPGRSVRLRIAKLIVLLPKYSTLDAAPDKADGQAAGAVGHAQDPFQL
jgi:hypothetical protein